MSNNDENISKDVEMREETSFAKEDVEMTDANSADEDVEMADAEPVKKEQSPKKSTGGVATKLFVGSLSFKTDDAGLEEHFASAGKVLSAKIITDRETGRSRGFGFVEMASDEEAQTAIKNLNGKDLDGRTLAVNVAEKKEGGARTGGGFAGRGGDSRGAGGGGFAGRGGDSRGAGGFAGRGDNRGGGGGGFAGRGGDSRGNGGGRGDNRGGGGFGGRSDSRGGDNRGNGGGRSW
jgi:RNA recognition motif-containing protein